MDELIGAENHQRLADDIELLDGAAEESTSTPCTAASFRRCSSASALTNFGVEPFLKEFLRLTPTPLPRPDAGTGELVDPCGERFKRLYLQDPGQHEQEPPGPHRVPAHLLGQVRARHGGVPCAGGQEHQARHRHQPDGRRPRHRGRSLCGRHHRPVRPRHLLDRRYAVHRQTGRAVRGYPDLCARAFRPRHPGRHHEAQAVRQGHGADRPGRRDPDLPRPWRGHGGGPSSALSACCSSKCSSTA